MEDNFRAFIDAQSDWEKARSRTRRGLLSIFSQPQHQALIPFEDVRSKLRLFQNSYKGVHEIPLDKIVGSVDRYQDFTREFLPLVDSDATRWKRVAALQRGHGLPPIEVYKVGDAYFVKDGNHRVSVMRQLDAPTIEAHVWEYPTPVEIGSEDNIDDILIKAERAAFFEKTRLDETRPGHNIVFTVPGRYPELQMQIEGYRRNLSLIDGYEVSFEEAAASWYDMVYSLAAETIEATGLLKKFPGRTAADLYIWVYTHREEIAQREGRRVSTQEAASDLVEKESQPPLARAVRQVIHGVEDLVGAGARLVQDVFANGEKHPAGPTVRVLAAQVHDTAPLLAFPAGDSRQAWRTWRVELRAKLADLLGIDPYPEFAAPPAATVKDREALKGARREYITFPAPDGLALPAYVFSPSDLRLEGRAPALLIFPGHGTIRQLAGLDYSHYNAAALALAQAGFVTIAVEQRGFGELGRGVDYYRLDAMARLVGSTWAGLTVDDGRRALDYLQSRPDVDPERLGVIGVGMGGGLAIHLAALDERILASLIGDYLVHLSDATERGPRYMAQCVPYLRQYAEVGDLGALIAPRPALYITTEAGVRQDKAVFRHIAQPYELLEVPDRLRHEETGPGRVFDNPMAAQWFKRWLVEETQEELPLLRHPLRPD